MGQNQDKFILITKQIVRFLSTVDKCDLLVFTRTKPCPRRQILKDPLSCLKARLFTKNKQKMSVQCSSQNCAQYKFERFSTEYFRFLGNQVSPRVIQMKIENNMGQGDCSIQPQSESRRHPSTCQCPRSYNTSTSFPTPALSKYRNLHQFYSMQPVLLSLLNIVFCSDG